MVRASRSFTAPSTRWRFINIFEPSSLLRDVWPAAKGWWSPFKSLMPWGMWRPPDRWDDGLFFGDPLTTLFVFLRGATDFRADGSTMTRSGVVDVRFAVPPGLDYGFFLFSFGWVLWVCSSSFVSIRVW